LAKKKPKIPPTTKTIEVIPQDLKDKWGSITAIATACNCLDNGYFPHRYAASVRGSIAYLAKLHEACVEDALKHPQAHMISELKELIKNMKEAKKNGTSAEAAAGAGQIEEATTFNPTPSPREGAPALS
jgi:hypothetical protein